VLTFENLLSDDNDDEEFAQLRKKQMEFLLDRFAALQMTDEVLNKAKGSTNVVVIGEETNYKESIKNATS